MADHTDTWVRFFNVLDQDQCDQTAYIYRIDARGDVIKPFWLKLPANAWLENELFARGGGQFRIIIRRGRTMVFSGRVAFEARQ